jgi:hypothetical protein
MKKYMTLGLVGLLGCNGNGSDSGRLEGSGFFFDEEGEPTSEQFYAIDAQLWDIINFNNGLQSEGVLDYSDLGDGEGEYFWYRDIVSYSNQELNFFNTSDGLWSNGNILSVSPYSASVVDGQSWKETPKCPALRDENGNVDSGELNNLLQEYFTDCGDQLLVYNDGTKFSLGLALTNLPESSEPEVLQETEDCFIASNNYCDGYW